MTSSVAWFQPDKAYRRHPGVAQSNLKQILVSPAHYKASLDRTFFTTPNMMLGCALHAAVLEGPEAFKASYITRPDGIKLNTKEGKDWAAAQKGKTILNGEQTEQLKGMVAALQQLDWFNPKRQKELRKYSEVSIYWEWLDIECKARLDRLIDVGDRFLALDLKSTDTVKPLKFVDKVLGLNYLFQSAYYSKAVTTALGKPVDFIFVGVEREAPHSINYFISDAEMQAEGVKQCEHALTTLRTCIMLDEWPGPPPVMNTMSLPSWYTSPVPQETEAPLF